jgi:hypothetical protein
MSKDFNGKTEASEPKP